MIFKDLTKTPSEIAIKVVGITEFYLDLAPSTRVQPIVQELINEDIPWGYFDGVVGGVPDRCGGGAVLHFDMQNYLFFKARFGEGRNNFVELSALRFLMSKALEWGVQSIQIFGDSKIIIN